LQVLRVFHDRLVDDGDRTWITDLIKSKVESHFRAKPANVFSHLVNPDTKELGPNELRMLLWGDFMVSPVIIG
jgi:dynein heavy chain